MQLHLLHHQLSLIVVCGSLGSIQELEDFKTLKRTAELAQSLSWFGS